MLKKSLVLMSISAAFFAQAQDISVIRNSAEIYSNSPNVGSSKFNAMAGANGALGGDASSLLTNPAGLGVAISGDASGTLSINSNKNTSSLAGSSVNYTSNKTDIGNAGGVIAIPLMSKTGWKFINIGVNYSNQSIENYVESPGNQNVIISKSLKDSNGNNVNGKMSYLGHNYDRLGNQSKMNIGVGANYENRLYIGAGLNFHYASIDQSEHALFGLDLDNSVDSYKKQFTPYSERSNGFSASIGVIGKISNQLRLGASIETPTWWNIDRAYSEYYVNKDDNNNIYYNNYGEDRSFRSPMKATVSAAFVPNKNFALNVDYTLGLTKPKYTVRGGAEADLNSFFNDLYKNVSEVKVGAEYRIQNFRLRGGYAYASSPFDAFSINAYNNAGAIGNTNYSDMILGSRNTIGAGIGYDFGQFYVDAAYQNITSNYKNVFLYGDADAGTGYYSGNFDVASPASVVSDVKNNRNNFFVTVGWKF
ncbi:MULTISPECIES: hemin receptor [unclassified Chryseobacterium]|uniref:OmpP1/FadL family transporter n=1 Tax=unclassified Chryseobacterium TaxID=2593645 RepID=UPI00162A4304|nr:MULTISPECIES: hemin receptor [unclassified Chryseobacterium]